MTTKPQEGTMKKVKKVNELVTTGNLSVTAACKKAGVSYLTYKRYADTVVTTGPTTTPTWQTTTPLTKEFGFVTLIYKTVTDTNKARTLVKAFYNSL